MHRVRGPHAPDHEVQIPAAQSLDQVGVRAVEDAQGKLGQRQFGLSHDLGHQPGGDTGQEADGQQRPPAPFHLCHAVEALAQGSQAHPGEMQEDLALRRQRHACAAANEERLANDLLQFLQRARHGRLGEIERLGRAVHAALARDFHEGLNMADLDATVDHCLPISISKLATNGFCNPWPSSYG